MVVSFLDLCFTLYVKWTIFYPLIFILTLLVLFLGETKLIFWCRGELKEKQQQTQAGAINKNIVNLNKIS